MTSTPRDPHLPDPELPKKTGLDALDDLEFFDDKALAMPLLDRILKTGEKVGQIFEENKKKKREGLELKKSKVNLKNWKKKEGPKIEMPALDIETILQERIYLLTAEGKKIDDIVLDLIRFLKSKKYDQDKAFEVLNSSENLDPETKKNLKTAIEKVHLLKGKKTEVKGNEIVPREPDKQPKPRSKTGKAILVGGVLAGTFAAYATSRFAFRLVTGEIAEVRSTLWKAAKQIPGIIVNPFIKVGSTVGNRVSQGAKWGWGVVEAPKEAEAFHPQTVDGTNIISRTWQHAKNGAGRVWNGTKNATSWTARNAARGTLATAGVLGMGLEGAVEGTGRAAVEDVAGVQFEASDLNKLKQPSPLTLASAASAYLSKDQVTAIASQPDSESALGLIATALGEKNVGITFENFLKKHGFSPKDAPRIEGGALGIVGTTLGGIKRMAWDRPWEATRFAPFTLALGVPGAIDIKTGLPTTAWSSFVEMAKGIKYIDLKGLLNTVKATEFNKAYALAKAAHPGASGTGLLFYTLLNLPSNQLESLVDSAVDVSNSNSAVVNLLSTVVVGARNLFYQAPEKEEAFKPTYGQFGNQLLEHLDTEEKQRGFLREFNPATFERSFRLLTNKTRLARAIQEDKAAVLKQVDSLFDLDGVFDRNELNAHANDILARLHLPAASTDQTLQQKSQQAQILVNECRNNLLEPGIIEGIFEKPLTFTNIDYDHFGDQVLENIDTEKSRDAFLRVFNSATFERSFRLLVNGPRLVKAVADDKETVKRQADILFDLGGVFDRDELNTHADAIMAQLGNPSTILDPVVREKCRQARTLVDQCRKNLITTGAIDAIFAKSLTFTNIDYDRFGDQLLEEVNTPEEIDALLRGFKSTRFENCFRILLSEETLTDSLSNDPQEVKKKIDQLFDLSGRYGHGELTRHATQMLDLFRTHNFSSTELETKAQHIMSTVVQVVKNLRKLKVVERLMEKPKEKEINVGQFGKEIINIKDEEVLSALRTMNMFTVAATFGRLRDAALVEDLVKTPAGREQLKPLIAQFFGLETGIGPNEIQAFRDQFETKFSPSRADRSSIEYRNFTELSKLIRDIASALNAERLQKIYKVGRSRKKAA